MKKLLFLLFGLVLLAFFLYSPNHAFDYKYLNIKYLNKNNEYTVKGKLITADNKREIYLQQNKIILINHSTNEKNSLTIPESNFTNISILKNKTKSESPLIGKYIKYGLKLTNKSKIYLVSIEPQLKLITSYPTPLTIEDKILINKNNNILYFYRKGELLKAYQVATGKLPEYTPEGIFKIANKIRLPDGDDPDSLYGPCWMGLIVPSEKDLRAKGKKDLRAPRGHKYGIHGTNEPDSIGTHASGGCIRMNNKEVIKFYNLVKIGTPVEIIK